jgi:hypothetical protein
MPSCLKPDLFDGSDEMTRKKLETLANSSRRNM